MIKLETYFEIKSGFNVTFHIFLLLLSFPSYFRLSIYLLGFGKLTQHFLPQDEGPHWPKVTGPWQVNSSVKARSDSQAGGSTKPHRTVAALSHPVLDHREGSGENRNMSQGNWSITLETLIQKH